MAHRVLIADAEKVVANTLAIVFERAGYEVERAYGGVEAMGLADRWRPDLLVAEIFLFDQLLGVELGRRVTAKYPHCRVILLSGQGIEELVKEAVGLGFTFFAKPVYPGVLLERAGALLGR